MPKNIVVAGRIERQNLMASLALGGGGWGGKLLPSRLARHDFWVYHIGGQTGGVAQPLHPRRLSAETPTARTRHPWRPLGHHTLMATPRMHRAERGWLLYAIGRLNTWRTRSVYLRVL